MRCWTSRVADISCDDDCAVVEGGEIEIRDGIAVAIDDGGGVDGCAATRGGDVDGNDLIVFAPEVEPEMETAPTSLC